MERVAVFGAQKGPRKNAKDIKVRLNMSGNNFGNYLIGYSIDKQVYNCDFFSYKEDFECINKNYDRAVIASSNFINSQQDLSGWADALEKLDMPITSIGLGAQMLSKDETLKLKKGTKRWLKIVSERSKSIGVRGEFTAEVLNKEGIKNVDIIGCPSAFMSLDRNFQIDTELNLTQNSKVLTHGNPRPNQVFYIDHLIETFSEYDRKFLAQTEWQLFKLKDGSIDLKEIDNFMDLAKRNKNSRDDIISNSIYFNDVDIWKRYLEDVSFSIGGRFHGNMLAAQMKVPAIWIVHDTRTKEFTDFYSFPSIHMDELATLSKSEILERFTYENFNKKYKPLYDNYAQFLLKNGIENKLELA
ncbi:MAG: polysaccharide pyruvyl transferase family protein [Bacteroidota bacterium]|nr:polysaccharide pyruvyl transferase family protein [Bacteroidota bacterium]